MNHTTLIPLFGLLMAPWLAQAQGVDADAMRRCRGVADLAQRLACYDAVPVPAAGAAAASAAAALPATPRTAPVAAGPSPASTTSTALPTSPDAAPAGIASFGLEDQQRQRTEVDAVTSSLPGSFGGWGPRTRFALANGQVWQVSDDSSGVYNLQSPKVTVRRAALGSFMLEIEGARKAPRVRRVE